MHRPRRVLWPPAGSRFVTSRIRQPYSDFAVQPPHPHGVSHADRPQQTAGKLPRLVRRHDLLRRPIGRHKDADMAAPCRMYHDTDVVHAPQRSLLGFLNTHTSSCVTRKFAFAPFRMPGHSTRTRSMSCSPCRCNSSACHSDTRTISPLRMWFLTFTTNTPPGRRTRMHSAQMRLCASWYASPHWSWPVFA